MIISLNITIKALARMNSIDPENPYQAPEAPVYLASASRKLDLVSGWRRLGTHLIDTVCFYILVFFVSIVVTSLFGESWLQALEGRGSYLLGWAVMLVYYIGFESAFARTPGKFVLGTVVVDENGSRPTLGQCVGRSFARLIPFEPLSCTGSQSRGWHDSLAKTFVVRANRNQ
jgi:uncharacterized RDD family membrane protein YckC